METIKYEIYVYNTHSENVKRSIVRSGLEIVDSYPAPDCGTCLVISGTLEQIKGWHAEQDDFDFEDSFIVEEE